MFHKLQPNVLCIYTVHKKGLPLQNNLTFVQHPAATCLRFICWSSGATTLKPGLKLDFVPPPTFEVGRKKFDFVCHKHFFLYENLSENSNYFNQVNKIVRNFFETRCSSPVTSTHLSPLTPLLPSSSPPPPSMHK